MALFIFVPSLREYLLVLIALRLTLFLHIIILIIAILCFLLIDCLFLF